jgi:hypothetical protein
VQRFIANHRSDITAVLSGFDRLIFRGTLLGISYPQGLMNLLWKRQVLLKDFGPYAQGLTDQLRAATYAYAESRGRPVRYILDSSTDKAALALKIARQDGISSGLIAVLTSIESWPAFEVFRNKDIKKLQLVRRLRKGLTFYHYWLHPVFGFMHARIQSWIPFSIHVWINGREWLARAMDKLGHAYKRRDNSFVHLSNPPRAQRLMLQQLRTPWSHVLNQMADTLNPVQTQMFRGYPLDYYWTVNQSEWATDLLFKDPASLDQIYPPLVLHGMTSFSSPDVMRFLGHKLPDSFKGEVITDFKHRTEGVRIKHRVGQNSVKLYNKQGSVLRVETTLNHPYHFRVWRPSERNPKGPKAWQVMRKGICDLFRRAQVSQAVNHRYLDALASVDTSVPLGKLAQSICQPTTWRNKRVRALRPWSPEDTQLFQLVSRGEFAVHGFRNRDLQALLWDTQALDLPEKRRRSARVSRLLRMLRAHGLIRKINATHRYTLSSGGRDILTAILSTQNLTLQQINRAAA